MLSILVKVHADCLKRLFTSSWGLKQLTQKESIDYYVGEMLFIYEKIKAYCEKSGLNNS